MRRSSRMRRLRLRPVRRGRDRAESGESVSALVFEQVYQRGFRNLGPLDWSPSPRFNVLAGDNGQGKSNLLECLSYLGALRSFRSAPTDELIVKGDEQAVLAAKIREADFDHTLKVKLARQGRSRALDLNGKRPKSIAVWRGICPVVLFHPGDLELAQGGPDKRRSLLDEILLEIDPHYDTILSTYTKALRSRNRLLKDAPHDRRSIRSYDPILASSGASLARARHSIVEALAPIAIEACERILGSEKPVKIRYVPRVEPSEEALTEALARAIEKDLQRGYTTEGPHVDDLSLELTDHAARHHASQGQQRTIVLALKIAELQVLASRTGRLAPLLLDDVSSELDRIRQQRFFALLEEVGSQVFLTTTHPELIPSMGQEQRWRIEEGALRPL